MNRCEFILAGAALVVAAAETKFSVSDESMRVVYGRGIRSGGEVRRS